jgi:isochorismate synthase/2-succinyl-5-enolpyruvyl-6-hydroxy-3-cyclohexene-1-carboxylate synthase/2-succinyl-6-hydroxy-2,4-cyclohexadiene-1-carboxylate synthase/O-succinylbenzoate synthase
VLIYGEKDTKFKTIAQEMFYEACRGNNIHENHEIVEIPNCGHAAHLENPLPIISALRQFLTKLKTTSFSI